MEDEFGQFMDGNKMGIIKYGERIIIPAIYDLVEISPDNIFLVSHDEKHAYFNEYGEMFLPFEDKYGSYGYFSEGLARVRHKATGKWGYINRQGTEVITPQFHFAEDFSDDMAIVRDELGKHGAIDKLGNIIVDYRYEHLLSFKNGFAKFGNFKKWGLIDKYGNVVVAQEYEYIKDVQGNTVIVQVKEGERFKEGLLTIGGSIEWNNNMDSLNDFLDRRKDFEQRCEQLINDLYAIDCPCAYKRFRNFITWGQDITFIDQEILFGKFKNNLKKLGEGLYQCNKCHTIYKEHWEQYSAVLWVLNVIIDKQGDFKERGADVKNVIPVSLGFQGYKLERIKDKYTQVNTDVVIDYLREA